MAEFCRPDFALIDCPGAHQLVDIFGRSVPVEPAKLRQGDDSESFRMLSQYFQYAFSGVFFYHSGTLYTNSYNTIVHR
jgi:hypothetical protein